MSKAPMPEALFPRPLAAEPLRELFVTTRARTMSLIDGLHPEDMTAQSMEDASPTKWHLAHTTWFFEQFVLRPHLPRYRSSDERFASLFNSYYLRAGPRFERAQRGLVTRPAVDEVLDYRRAVEKRVSDGLESGALPRDLVELGCHHEMQHQELMLTDLLHLLSHNPLRPAYRHPGPLAVHAAAPLDWHALDGGIVPIGHDGDTFAFDCETPRHDALIRPFELASRAVTNGEWIEFIDDGGYSDARLWLADGWAAREAAGWQAPDYWWRDEDDRWTAFGLRGAQPVDLDAPVAHVSYFESDAFARWTGARLPTEFEREATFAAVREGRVAGGHDGALLDGGRLRPARAAGEGLAQLTGDVWEWTASAYLPYPGFRVPEGAVGEYNGKFMNGQYVLRGGSALTPAAQLRDGYRNFFAPHVRFQMSGLRLARDPDIAESAQPWRAPRDATRDRSTQQDAGNAVRPEAPIADFATSVLASFARTPRVFEPKWFYDAEGSVLFETITRTEAYYPTRTELAILESHAANIARTIGPNAILFEPGAGAARKVRPLLRELEAPCAYVPGDIDIVHLDAALEGLRAAQPTLQVLPVELDFTHAFTLPATLASARVAGAPLTVFFPGSTIGNFAPDDAVRLLARFADELDAGQLVIGFDLPPGPGKSRERLERAYDDEDGVTAAFNRNLLARMNRELEADVDPGEFRHIARFDAATSRIEMHLEARRAQRVNVAGQTFEVAAGERLLTEWSYKHSLEAFDVLAAPAGWRRQTHWQDDAGWYAVAAYERG